MPCRKEFGLFKAPGPHRAKLAGPQGHRKDDWVEASEEGKKALPGLWNLGSLCLAYLTAPQTQVWVEAEFRVKCVTEAAPC